MIVKKVFIFFIASFISAKVFAQGNWGGGVDEENLHFGFVFQYVASDYKIIKVKDWRTPVPSPPPKNISDPLEPTTANLQSISSQVNPGFGIGFVSNLYITPHLDFRFTPSLVFTDRIVDFKFADGANYEQEGVVSPDGFTRRAVNATMAEFPFGLKLKSDRRNNFRAYILAGAKYGIDVASKKRNDDADFIHVNKYLKNANGILSYEVGIGFDLYLEFFKLSPEIKLSNSISNVLDQKGAPTPYNGSIDKLFLRNFQFSLYFE